MARATVTPANLCRQIRRTTFRDEHLQLEHASSGGAGAPPLPAVNFSYYWELANNPLHKSVDSFTRRPVKHISRGKRQNVLEDSPCLTDESAIKHMPTV